SNISNLSYNVKQDINNINCPFTLSELMEAIGACKIKTAAGPDNISYQLISNLPDSGKIFLLEMINLSWSTGDIPSGWKSSFVKPILKPNKSSAELSSFRPITLSNTIPKIMERLVAYRISWFLTKHQLLNPRQSGFQRGCQTVDQVYRLVREARCAIDGGDMTVAILIDFSNAFDLVWIDAVILKLMKLNLTGCILRWIKNFLEIREYRVKIAEDLSEKYSLDNGTPQGSSLSPLLFLVMVNDFPELSAHTSTGLFADDSSIWRSGTNIEQITHHIQSDINLICEWCTKWGFKINTSKTVGIVFTKKLNFKTPTICINGEKIDFVDSVKMLGITIDKKLNWKTHIQGIVDRCAQCLNLLRLLSGSAFGSSKKALIAIYRGLIRSRIDYGCFLYQDSARTNLKLLDTLQYKSLLLCTGGMKGTALASLLSECGETTLAQRRYEFHLKFITRIWFSKKSACYASLNNLTLTTLNKKSKSMDLIAFNTFLTECNINSTLLAINDNINLNPPWSAPLDNIDTTLIELLKQAISLENKRVIMEDFIVET
ncbi:MAG: RNA-directed DNA polymerase, partial [Nitrososphaerales archaeon]